MKKFRSNTYKFTYLLPHKTCRISNQSRTYISPKKSLDCFKWREIVKLCVKVRVGRKYTKKGNVSTEQSASIWQKKCQPSATSSPHVPDPEESQTLHEVIIKKDGCINDPCMVTVAQKLIQPPS
ncbi:uncharacterized protein LOC110837386 [Zootermopsis nevadensis]|uniref:uncharacterized protein LOC110837386 n=1 Tax=Zootermopsis nevadensis TaxID=136037 RepID=UPI000B8E9127|nr:uncharacterized protein LOC110837386 [Zootermopsis nevadensis]